MPMDRIGPAIRQIGLSEAGWDDAAHAIMTTDTRPKVAQRELTLSGGAVRIGGIAKGAGMIHPNMATLLAFVTTDALIDGAALRPMLRSAADESFNAISVDGDTSTNDTLLVLANGASGVRVGTLDGPAFLDALAAVCLDLARAIVADGEGATKVFEIHVTGAASETDARVAARTVTNSNLVKTAIHGADPNWGRILAAAGRSGAKVDAGRASVRIGGVGVFERGAPQPFDAGAIRTILERPDVAIELDLGLGGSSARAWGSDLSAEYVRINADYTT
jgi:glutamate N-acetyltransferase / amino-acid N-acetyltransferase